MTYMKRFFACIAFATVFVVSAFAQYALPADTPPAEEGTAAETAISVLKRHRKGLKLDGVKLTAEEQEAILKDIGGVDYNDQWAEYVSRRKLGAALTGAGCGVAALGATVFAGTGLVYVVGLIFVAPASSIGDNGEKTLDDYRKEFDPWFVGSGIVTAAGATMFVAGLPMLISNNRKLKKITDEYNRIEREKAGVQLAFASTPNGLGLVLTF